MRNRKEIEEQVAQFEEYKAKGNFDIEHALDANELLEVSKRNVTPAQMQIAMKDRVNQKVIERIIEGLNRRLAP